MSVMELRIEGFSFPDNLPDNRANFRVVFDIRYRSGTGAKAKPQIVTAVSPGADTFWECDRGRSGKPNFVRAHKQGSKDWDNRVDIGRLDEWDRTVIFLNADTVDAVRAKVFDVDREGFWDHVGAVAGAILEGLGKTVEKAAPGSVKDATKDAYDEISSFLIKKLVGGGDKVLFQGSGVPDGDGVITITGRGTDGHGGSGEYHFKLKVV